MELKGHASEITELFADGRKSDLDVALFCEQVNTIDPHHIDQQRVLRTIMDQQYEKTLVFFSAQFAIYLVFFCAPMLYYLVYPSEISFGTVACFVSAACVAALLIIYEFFQMKSEGVDYFKDFWNVFNLCGFAAFLALFIRMLSKEKGLAEFDMFLNCFVALQMLLKVNYFLRVYQ